MTTDALAEPTMSLEQLGALLGVGRSTIYDLHTRDELPVRVLTLGRRLRVVTADVRELLGLNSSAAGAPTPAVATTDPRREDQSRHEVSEANGTVLRAV